MKLEMLKKVSTFDAAVGAISNYIIGNRLQAGDVLPPEPELAVRLGISRNILREALRHFRTLGIIESKPKTGTVIRSLIPDNPYAGYFPFLAALTDVQPRLLELRISLETGAAPLMVDRITPEQIAHLRQICKQFRAVKTREMQIQLDMEFHLLLISAAANPFLSGLTPLVVQFFTEIAAGLTDAGGSPGDTAEDQYNIHAGIIDALEQRDADALRTTLSAHYADHNKKKKRR